MHMYQVFRMYFIGFRGCVCGCRFDGLFFLSLKTQVSRGNVVIQW